MPCHRQGTPRTHRQAPAHLTAKDHDQCQAGRCLSPRRLALVCLLPALNACAAHPLVSGDITCSQRTISLRVLWCWSGAPHTRIQPVSLRYSPC
jgi:hypothetical protein